MTSPKSRTAMRDEAAEKRWENMPSFAATELFKDEFKAGWDAATKLDDEALKIAVEALEKIKNDIRYAINNGQLGGPANFILSSKEIDCDVALAEIFKLRGEND